jgi:hypothetical protein
MCAPEPIFSQLLTDLYGAYAFELMTDKYANFVMQKAMEVAPGEKQVLLINKVLELSASLRTYTYGRHVLNAVEKIRKSKSR